MLPSPHTPIAVLMHLCASHAPPSLPLYPAVPSALYRAQAYTKGFKRIAKIIFGTYRNVVSQKNEVNVENTGVGFAPKLHPALVAPTANGIIPAPL